MLFSKLLLALCSTASALHARGIPHKRATSELGTFYAYGTNMSGVPIFYGDGLAYIGTGHPANITEATNVTFSVNNDGNWVATPTNTSLVANWTTPRLFIDQDPGAFVTAGFTSASNTSVTTAGFDMFGTLVTWINSSSGALESKWYAAPTGQDGLWFLMWNVDNVISATATPVALKNIPPS